MNLEKNIDVDEIKRLCKCGAIRWTNHAFQRLIERNIRQEDVEYSLKNGEVIEQNPNARPYPKCLMLAMLHDKTNAPLHVVCGIGKDELYIITTYYPNPLKWNEDFKKRIAGG